jgi:cell shape-determining protein MreD
MMKLAQMVSKEKVVSLIIIAFICGLIFSVYFTGEAGSDVVISMGAEIEG